ncbi:MAG TPA: methionyl-tRNA formyltransferase [Candidatus Megaira endosymbiont of Hartmannula sinica]|nr:methionyl-tRNA formyltransferase [Candidatus Megaera endosymbiont of Hartmannula sinica]
MKVIFMGTPSFAVPILESIINSPDHELVAVFTKEPKKQNRGMKVIKSDVHQYIESYITNSKDNSSSHNNNDIAIYNPKTLRTEDSYNLIKSIEADIIVVAAYGFILPKNILEMKKYGCINIHPSDLPKYRGAAPIQRTVINRDSKSSVCVMQMSEGMDEGDILLKEDIIIDNKNITSKQLHDSCAIIGGRLIIKFLNNINNIKPTKQRGEVIYANKLTKEEGQINFEKHTASHIDAMIRGMNPWPGVYFYYRDTMIKIDETIIIASNDIDNDERKYNPGDIFIYNRDNTTKSIIITCAANSFIEIIKIRVPSLGLRKAIDYFRDKI